MSNVIPLARTDQTEMLVENFRQYLLRSDRAKSARSYVSDIRDFFTWLEKKAISIKSITPLDMTEYRAYLQIQGRKPSTVNRKLVSLRIFFNWLVQQKLILDNPAENIKPVTTQGLTPKWLTRQEQAALMRAVREKQNPRDEALITLILHTGLRVSEVASLIREDIFIGERSGKVIVRQGKGNKYREVPLNKTVRHVMQKWFKANPDGPLFPNRYKKPLSTRAIHNIISEYAYYAKLRDVSPHTLRHTFCKNLIDAGVPIDQVAMMAGHSKLDITRVYTAPSIDDLQSAVEKTAWE